MWPTRELITNINNWLVMEFICILVMFIRHCAIIHRTYTIYRLGQSKYWFIRSPWRINDLFLITKYDNFLNKRHNIFAWIIIMFIIFDVCDVLLYLILAMFAKKNKSSVLWSEKSSIIMFSQKCVNDHSTDTWSNLILIKPQH